MARLKARGNEVGLREYLLDAALDLRNTYGRHGDEFWSVLSKSVTQLVGRERYGFYRYQLPDDHPLRRARDAAGMCDHLVLTEDDRLIGSDDA